MISLREEEVYAVRYFFDVDCLFVCALLKDELFEVEKGSLVWYFLPYLDNGSPGVVCVRFGAVGTLSVLLYKFDVECLLEYCAFKGFLLHSDLQLSSSRMWLGPDERGVYYSALVQSS